MGWGRSGRVRHTEFREWNQGSRLKWRSNGYEVRVLEINMGQGGAGIGVPVWCCTECNTVLQMTVFVVLPKSQSRIDVMLRIQNSCLEVNVESMKQCVEPEFTSVAIVMEGIRLEVSCNVKEFGLERVNALRCSSTEAL